MPSEHVSQMHIRLVDLKPQCKLFFVPNVFVCSQRPSVKNRQI